MSHAYVYDAQVEADEEKPYKDHFADWEPESDKNKLLLYGSLHVTDSLRWDPALHAYVKVCIHVCMYARALPCTHMLRCVYV
jgi:hypothetical protein